MNVRSVSAMRLQAKGDFASANEHLDRSLEIEPNQGFAHFAFVFNNPASETDEDRKARMETLVRSASLPPTETMYLHYALGRMAENHGEFEDAMRNYDLANQILRRLRFGDQAFDAVGYRRRFEEIRKTFDAKFMGRNRGRGSSSQLPVLLVGMMRSGTTLMEQILSSHPNVSPGGENPFWFSKYQQALNRPGSLAGWESNLRRQGHEYLERLEKLIVPPISRVTDKMPAKCGVARTDSCGVAECKSYPHAQAPR